MKFLRFQNIESQALVNASRSATRVHQTRTLTDGYATIKVLVGSALPATTIGLRREY